MRSSTSSKQPPVVSDQKIPTTELSNENEESNKNFLTGRLKKAILADKQYSKAYYLLGAVFLNELDNKNAEKNLENSIKYFEKN